MNSVQTTVRVGSGLVSVSVSVLANNALRAHHASVHGGVSTNGLSAILLIFWEMIRTIELLEIMFDGRAFHYLAVVGKKMFPNVFDGCLI